MVPIVGKEVKRNADLIEVLKGYIIPQGGADPRQHRAQDHALGIELQVREHYTDGCAVLVPSSDIGLSGGCQQRGYNVVQRFTALFRTLSIAVVQQHQQKRFLRPLRPFSLNRDHPTESFFTKDGAFALRTRALYERSAFSFGNRVSQSQCVFSLFVLLYGASGQAAGALEFGAATTEEHIGVAAKSI